MNKLSAYLSNPLSSLIITATVTILIITSFVNIFSDKGSEFEREFGSNFSAGAYGYHNAYEFNCSTPNDCEDFLEILYQIQERLSDPQYNHFITTVSETIRLYSTGEHTSWEARARFSVQGEPDPKLEILSLTITSAYNGTAQTFLGSSFEHNFPSLLSDEIEQYFEGSVSFADYVEIQNRRMEAASAQELEPITITSILTLMKPLAKRTLSILLFAISSIMAAYGSRILLLAFIIKSDNQTLPIDRGISALAVSLPVLLALSST